MHEVQRVGAMGVYVYHAIVTRYYVVCPRGGKQITSSTHILPAGWQPTRKTRQPIGCLMDASRGCLHGCSGAIVNDCSGPAASSALRGCQQHLAWVEGAPSTICRQASC